MPLRLVMLALLLAGCALPPAAAPTPTLSPKIALDLSGLNADGLIGPPDGLRALSYEFCIPRGDAYHAEVRAIDSSTQFSPSRGRIGCTGEQTLVIGSTHQPGFRAVLARLAALPYVTRIQRADFE